MVDTYLVDLLFEKFTLYAASLKFKDENEANYFETEESRNAYDLYLMKLNDEGYFDLAAKGQIDAAKAILEKLEKTFYKETNAYYLRIKKESNLSFYELRTLKHLSLIPSNKASSNLTSVEEIEFKTIFDDELNYFKSSQFRFDSQDKILFSKISIIFLLFSTIMRMIKQRQQVNITDQNINEYYLNNFLVSNGFLFYNNIPYDKKKVFVKHIIEFYRGKGTLKTVKSVVDILNDKDVDIYEYYLFYDEKETKYYFLKVKPDESFIKVFNELRSDREVSFDLIVNSDPSWLASEEDLLKRRIKFIKTKYFSIDSYSDAGDAMTELSFLLNKMRRYRDLFGSIHKFEIEGFNEGIELTDFLLFLSLMAMRVSGYTIESIKQLYANEDINKFFIPPKAHESNLSNNKDAKLPDLIAESIKEIQEYSFLADEIENYKKYSKIDTNTSVMELVRDLRLKRRDNYNQNYRLPVPERLTIKAFDYLINKHPQMLGMLSETDASILSTQFLGFIDALERMLILYGQNAFKFKDIYASLYLPKIVEIVNFFKSMNAHLLEFSNALSIDKESREDILSDAYSAAGVVRVSNRDRYGSGNSGNKDYFPDNDFPNKDSILDREIELGNKYLKNIDKMSPELFGAFKNTNQSNTQFNDTIVHDAPMTADKKASLLMTSFGNGSSLITDYTEIFDTHRRLEEILKDENKMYYENYILDFYGTEGTYKDIREKYGLSPKEFKEELAKIFLKYDGIFGSVMNKINVRKEEFILKKEGSHIPFLKKPYILRKVANKVTNKDLLFQDLKHRTTFTDVIAIYEATNNSQEYKYSEELNTTYRSLNRRENDKFSNIGNSIYSGKRNYSAFIEELKQRSEDDKVEQSLIGSIPIPDLDFKTYN